VAGIAVSNTGPQSTLSEKSIRAFMRVTFGT
jgi:hypothetical protein